MHLYGRIPDGEKYWDAPETRKEAIEEAAYYAWMNCPLTAIKIIVALCASIDKKGTDKYDESLETAYVTHYQREKK